MYFSKETRYLVKIVFFMNVIYGNVSTNTNILSQGPTGSSKLLFELQEPNKIENLLFSFKETKQASKSCQRSHNKLTNTT